MICSTSGRGVAILCLFMICSTRGRGVAILCLFHGTLLVYTPTVVNLAARRQGLVTSAPKITKPYPVERIRVFESSP